MTVFDRAILFAVNAHSGQTRKAKDTPYILHPLEAATIVGKYTSDEEVLAAAVLHDTIEDAGVSREDLAGLFGERVADLVAAESEDKREGIPASDTWMIRKEETLADLGSASRDVKLICLGDKLSNMRELAGDYAKFGDALWDRFNQKDKALHAWYYGSILDVMRDEFGEIPAVTEFRSLWDSVFG